MAASCRDSHVVSSVDLAAVIASTDFSDCSATVVGYGNMGKQYVEALRALGIRKIRVCSRSQGPLLELGDVGGINAVAGGFRHIEGPRSPNELGVVATPIADLIAAARHLAAVGYRKILIEKPVALWADRIQQLAEALEKQGVDAVCGYNRVAYPSFHEVRARTQKEGGVTSCTYNFTELVHSIDPNKYPREVTMRWGIANSLHVMSMAHGLIGMPKAWSGHRSGKLPWHPSGSVFVGSGISDSGVPFAYHADWGSTGRWSVEFHTTVSSYRLCPLEKLFRRTSQTGEWQEIRLTIFVPTVKAGFVEQVAAMLKPAVRRFIPLFSLHQASTFAKYAESLFGYDSAHEIASTP